MSNPCVLVLLSTRGTIESQSVLDWLQYQRREYREFDTAGRNELDALEEKLRGLISGRSRR